MKENICPFKTSTCKSKEGTMSCVSKETETWRTEMENIKVNFTLPVLYDQVCDFSGSKIAAFICRKRKWSPLDLSSEPKMALSDIFGQDDIFYFIFSFLKVLSMSFKWRFGYCNGKKQWQMLLLPRIILMVAHCNAFLFVCLLVLVYVCVCVCRLWIPLNDTVNSLDTVKRVIGHHCYYQEQHNIEWGTANWSHVHF